MKLCLIFALSSEYVYVRVRHIRDYLHLVLRVECLQETMQWVAATTFFKLGQINLESNSAQ